VPLGQNLNITRLGIQGQPPAADASQAQYAVPQSVSPDFLTMLHIPLLAGRGIAAGDGASNQPVALVSANLARRYWPQGDAIGHMVQLGTGAAASPWLRVVGIVGDVKWAWGDKNVEYTVYRPAEQAPDSNPYLLVRAAAGGDVTRFGPALRRMVTEVDRNQPLGEVKSLAELI